MFLDFYHEVVGPGHESVDVTPVVADETFGCPNVNTIASARQGLLGGDVCAGRKRVMNSPT